MQGIILLVHPTLCVGWGEVGQQHGIRTTLGNDCLADVAGGIVIEMGGWTDELLAPVVGPHPSIASWCEL